MSLSKGERYTFDTNKNGRGKKKTIVAIIKGAKSQDVIDFVNKIPLEKRKLVKEITLDMANDTELASIYIKHIAILLSLEIFMKKHQENSPKKKC